VSISRKGINLPDDRWRYQMRVLVIGAGVIGTVYGAQLAAAGHPVSVLRHGRRTDEVARLGLVARDVVDHTSQTAPVELVPEAGAGSYDLVGRQS
jgi:2-dehydropantoate 2-reductase